MPYQLKQLLPSVARGVYRFNQQRGEYVQNGEYPSFVKAKLSFLPHPYQEKIIQLLEPIALNIQGESSPPPKANNKVANSLFDKYPYLAKETSENYLEKQFFSKVLTHVFNYQMLPNFVYHQHPVGNFLLDFAIVGECKYAIELDGFEKFQNRANLNDFLRRQNYIVANGWQLFRYSYTDVINNTSFTIEELKGYFSQDKVLAPSLKNHQIQGKLFDETPSSGIPACNVVDYFFAIQDYFIDYLINTTNDDVCFLSAVKIKENLNLDFSLADMALLDLYYYLEAIQIIFDVKIDLPEIWLYQKSQSICPKTESGSVHSKIKINPSNKIKDSDFDLLLSEQVLQKNILASRSNIYAIDSVSFRRDTDENYNSKQDIHKKLKYFAKSIFDYDGIRYGQDDVFAKIFKKHNVLGLLPTGSGKSFCFWLPAIIKPGLTIVICPLKSLMRDQMLSLKNHGIYSAAFINSDVQESQRQAIYIDIKLGRIRLLYISPERMQIKDFIKEIDEIMTFIPINFLVIDEAHCVSEWGHDFRPSYLKIPYFKNQLQARNSTMTTIALTATAGELVKKDMMTILQLTHINVVSAGNFNRPNLSLQFIAVKNYTEKAEQFSKVIENYLPSVLNRADIYQIFKEYKEKDKKLEKGVGLIFCIYANSHGKHTIKDGVGYYLRKCQALIEKNHEISIEDFSQGTIRGFSSTKPTLCPNCSSSEYISTENINSGLDDADSDENEDEAKNLKNKFCTQCNAYFSEKEAKTPPSWERVLRKNQEAFKSGDINLMVATKGFGMGIDKGSVRFVVHTSMASGMESWYQEAGRAGRDEGHAHCISIVDIPNEICLDALVENAEVPNCTRKSCPHGKAAICDYGKQHNFIAKSYHGIAADTVKILCCLDELIKQSTNSSIILKVNLNYQQQLEISLFRLMTLGVIQDYTLNYKNYVFIEVIGFDVTVNAKKIKAKLREYLNKHDIKNNEIKTENEIDLLLEKLKQLHQKEVENKIRKNKNKMEQYQRLLHYFEPNHLNFNTNNNTNHQQLIDIVMQCSFVMLEHIYDDVRGMRYEALKKLREVFINNTNLPINDCRRFRILSYFQTEKSQDSEATTLNPNYRCGFCDTCQPNLQFKGRTRSEPLEFADDLAEVDMQFQDWLTNSDVFTLDKGNFFIQAYREYPINAFGKATYILVNSNPRNLKALYIARHFATSDEKLKYSHRLLETANRRKQVTIETIYNIYETTEISLQPKIFEVMLDTIGRLLNDSNGEEWLYEQAESLQTTSNIDPEIVEILGLRVIANKLPTIPFSEYQCQLNALLEN